MRPWIRLGTRAFAVLLLFTASAPFPLSQAEALPSGVAAACASYSGGGGALAQDPPPKCCFSNPGYAGTCEVQPAKDESCGQILGYLNNPMSQGKGYCGNTTLRGGWQSAVCEPKK